MRRALTAALLLLLLGVPRAFASAQDEEEGAEHFGYREAVGNSETQDEGHLHVSVRAGTLKAPRGYTPLEVVLQNSGPAPLQARVSFQGQYGTAGHATERRVEVGPRQRVATWLLVPAVLFAGNLTVEAPGLGTVVQPVYLDSGTNGAVLVLGTVAGFESGTGLAKAAESQEPFFAARFIDPRDAPRELSAYVGYPVVAVAAEAPAIPSDVWALLEAYTATGGTLVLLRPPRDLRERFPLLPEGASSTAELYGFGNLRPCHEAATCGGLLSGLGPDALEGPVKPIGPPPRWERGHALNGGVAPMLSSARAPVGRFLLLIFAFALAVGPGGLMLARRKGPVAVLVAVPVVSAVTCLALIAWSVLVDGFAVHAARYSLTWLDPERSRAVTLGVAAWYANLSPGPVQLPASSALLAPDEVEDSLADLDWTGGLTVRSGFLPPRTYREWGEVAVLPSRGRLVLREEGGALRVQNALGAPLEKGLLMWNGAYHRLPPLADGAEGLVGGPEAAPFPELLVDLDLPEAAQQRFLPRAVYFRAPLPDGGFVVRVSGVGPAPTSVVAVQLEEGIHLVRGRVVEGRP